MATTPKVMARATSEPPKKPGPFLSLCASVETLARRLLALEQRDPPNPVKGDDGRGVAAARLNAAGELIFALSDGTELNVGLVRPEAPEPLAPVVQTVERIVEGKPGIGIAAAALNAAGELCLTLSDDRVLNVGLVKAKDGEPGKDAVPVEPPADGVGIASGLIDDRGNLILSLTDGRQIDAGHVCGKDGEPGKDATEHPAPANGVGIANAVQNEDGELLLALSDGRTLNVGRVRAKDGEPGKDAEPAAPGISVSAAVVNEAGHLILSMTDGAEIDAGVVVKQGEPGVSIKGDPGDRGTGIAKSEIVAGNLVLHLTDGSKQNVGRVVGKDGETKVIPAVGSEVEIGDTYRADITAKDLDRLRLREITVDGQTIQVLTLN